MNQIDGISKYFIVPPNSFGRLGLKDTGHVVEYGSDTHKLLYLLSEKIILPSAACGGYNPFDKDEYEIVKALVNAEIVSLPRDIMTNAA